VPVAVVRVTYQTPAEVVLDGTRSSTLPDVWIRPPERVVVRRDGEPLPHRTIELLAKHKLGLLGAITSKPPAAAEVELPSELRGRGLKYRSPILGLRQGRSISSASGDGLRSPTIAFGAAATVYFTVAYASPDGTATFHLEDNSGTSVASYTLQAAAVPIVVHFLLSWTGATAGNGKLRITSGSTGRAISVSSAMYAGLAQPARRTIPVGTPGAICPSVTISPGTLPNAEGELYADVALVTQGTATIARAWNGANTNDNRQLRLVTGNVVGKHSTGAGTNTDATISIAGIDTAIRYQARLRWQRVGLRDGTATEYTSARAEQGATVEAATGRTADWTPSATALQIVDLGHDDGSDVATGVIGRVRLRAREPRL